MRRPAGSASNRAVPRGAHYRHGQPDDLGGDQQAFVNAVSGAVLTADVVLVLAAVAVALRSPPPTPSQPTQETRTEASLSA